MIPIRKSDYSPLHRLSGLLFLIPVFVLPASSSEVETIVKKIDSLFRSDSSYAQIEMSISTPNWSRTLKMDAWTRGMDKTFIRILSPAKEKGVATLRIGTEMWNYLPRTNKVIKIPPSMMMSSWMGSDFTNDDLVKEYTFLDDYTYELVEVEDGAPDLLYIKFIPKTDRPIVWGEIIAAVHRQGYLPVWEKYYDEKGELIRILEFKEIREFDGRTIPSIMELIPQKKEGHKTVIRYIDIDFNPSLSEEIFSLRNLRSRG
jgi:outer membrane lipoprotein-sorting protein